jgi:hypothetical protein
VVDVDAKALKTPEQIENSLIEQAPAVQVIDLDEELGFVGGELELSAEADRLADDE